MMQGLLNAEVKRRWITSDVWGLRIGVNPGEGVGAEDEAKYTENGAPAEQHAVTEAQSESGKKEAYCPRSRPTRESLVTVGSLPRPIVPFVRWRLCFLGGDGKTCHTSFPACLWAFWVLG
eukprot:859470-Rhodomonas_salina.5